MVVGENVTAAGPATCQVRVGVRVRPLTSKEISEGGRSVVTATNIASFSQRLTQQTIQLDCYKFRFHFIIFCYNLVVDVILVGWNGVHLLKCSIVNVISVVSHFEATVYFHGTVGFFEVLIKIAEAHWLEV